MTFTNLYPSGRIALREVALRDGLQMVARYPSTAGKRRWITAEYEAGVRHFDIGSFLSPEHHPQFADIREIAGLVDGLAGALGSALVLNKRGALDAFDSAVPQLDCVVSASEEHSAANVRRTRREVMQEVREICALRDKTAHQPLVAVGIAMAFGCSIAGPVAQGEVLRLAEEALAAGADLISVADTVGYAGPDQIADMVGRLRALSADRPVGVHLHDTRGLGIANASAALDAGATVLDGALGGLGGCPAAPRASGNIVFEDLVFLCRTKGLDTGIDLEKLIAVRAIQEHEMPGENIYGALAKAGLPLESRPKGVSH
jgi:hydroxymethylglutaryl-CoA lyase